MHIKGEKIVLYQKAGTSIISAIYKMKQMNNFPDICMYKNTINADEKIVKRRLRLRHKY